MSQWISAEDMLPDHGQSVRTRDVKGREYDCQFFHWSNAPKGHFKLIGKVWEHDSVTHWMPPETNHD